MPFALTKMIEKIKLMIMKPTFVNLSIAILMFILISYGLFFIEGDSPKEIERQQKECYDKGDVPITYMKYDPFGYQPPKPNRVVCFDVS